MGLLTQNRVLGYSRELPPGARGVWMYFLKNALRWLTGSIAALPMRIFSLEGEARR